MVQQAHLTSSIKYQYKYYLIKLLIKLRSLRVTFLSAEQKHKQNESIVSCISSLNIPIISESVWAVCLFSLVLYFSASCFASLYFKSIGETCCKSAYSSGERCPSAPQAVPTKYKNISMPLLFIASNAVIIFALISSRRSFLSPSLNFSYSWQSWLNS